MFFCRRGVFSLDTPFNGRPLPTAQIEVVAMNADQAEIARAAWRKYGKGNHPAGLNIGGCCAYALAKYSGEPLLFKGNDFTQTDIMAAITF